MIQRLKRSFVTITVVSAALVLAVLMSVVNLTNYLERTNSDKEMLAYLAENGGHFPQDGKDASGEAGVRFDGGKGVKGDKRITVETPYETRYYSVFFPADGGMPYVDTSQIAAVTGDEAEAIARSLPTTGRKAARYGNYRYMTVESELGVLYIFLDCNRNIAAVRSFFINSIIVTAAGLAVLYLVARLLAGRAIRPIAVSYEKQKSFITNAGHELKTPLAVIESSTEVIEIESGESQWTRSIHSQVERLSTLTQELIALSRMDEGTAALDLAELDVSAVVAEALAPYAVMAEQKGRAFAAEIQEGVCLRANRGALEKVCGILADNAVKYTPEGGDIRFALTQSGGHVVLREENPAEGVKPGRREELFDRFYRGDASRSSAQPGYGLGLPLARALLEAMGGSITAESPDGKRLVITARLN